ADYGAAPEPEAEIAEEETVVEAALDMEPAAEEETVVAAEVEPELDLFEMGDDEDGAMAWLEQMAAGDEDITFDMEPPPITPSEDAKFAIDYGETAADEIEPEPAPEPEMLLDDSLAEDFDISGVPDDPDDAMAWLEQMAGGDDDISFDMEPPPITPSEDAKFGIDYSDSQTDLVEAGEPELAGRLSVDDTLTAVPEDPDDAMAWLEKMADEQSAQIDDEFGAAAPPDDTALPDWMQVEANEMESIEDLDFPDILEEDLPASKDEMSMDFMENLGVELDDDLSDSLPDWFSIESQESGSTGQTGWLRSVEEIDVSSWLSAEDEATAVDFEQDMALSDTVSASLPSKPITDHLSPLTEDSSDMPQESPEIRQTAVPTTSSPYQVDKSQLSAAQAALARDEYSTAVDTYKQMITSGSGAMTVIAELETVADEYPQEPAFRRLLGDAYMRNGQLQKALDTYRVALDQL
ncbi:MAG: tetratricopeptide repeat protein, partial [Chloroflexi bacterium]|nr:tetratricopeptide repeat protein [Chloroflexota bacterium]